MLLYSVLGNPSATRSAIFFFLTLQHLEMLPHSTFLTNFHMKRIFHRKNAAQTFQNTCLLHKRDEDG